MVHSLSLSAYIIQYNWKITNLKRHLWFTFSLTIELTHFAIKYVCLFSILFYWWELWENLTNVHLFSDQKIRFCISSDSHIIFLWDWLTFSIMKPIGREKAGALMDWWNTWVTGSWGSISPTGRVQSLQHDWTGVCNNS